MNSRSCVPSSSIASISVLLPILFECLVSSACVSKFRDVHGTSSEQLADGNLSGEEIRAAIGPGPWRWENPRPQGNDLGAVMVFGPNDVWVGGSQTLMHWNGKDWRLTQIESEAPWWGAHQIWGSDAANLWAVTDRELLHWRGDAWVSSGLPWFPSVYWGAVWGTGSKDVWTNSAAGVYHWDGDWSERTPDSWKQSFGGLPSLWGTSTDDVTVRDGTGQHFHWNGVGWQSIASPPGFYLGGTGPGEPWFYEVLQRLFFRLREGVWETYPSPLQYCWAAWSDSSHEAWALGRGAGIETSFLHFDGQGWSIAQTVPHRLTGIGGNAPDQVWAVGENGAIVRFNGNYEDLRAGSVADLKKVFGFSESEIWAVGNSGTVLRRMPTEWEIIQVPTQRNLLAISGTSASDIWVVGEVGTSLHFDGKTWSNIPTGIADDLVSVWASGPSDVWAATPQRPFHPFLHWDGTAWSEWASRPPGTVYAFWGFTPDDIWAVGAVCGVVDEFYCFKVVSHFDGSDWTVQSIGLPSDNFFNRLVAVWGSDSLDVWAVADNFASYHWGGEGWTQVDFPEISYCTGLWGRAKDDVYATCQSSVVHWDGSSWSERPTLSGQRLSGLWGVDSQFWVVGGGGTILRYSAIAGEKQRKNSIGQELGE